MTSSVRGLVLFLLQQSSEIDKLKQELPDLMLNEANFMAITKAMSEASGAPDGRYRADQTLASAMASKVQSIYTGIESILKDTLEQVDGYTPTGENWHRKLLDQASRPSPDGIRVPLISGGTLKTLELSESSAIFPGMRMVSNWMPRESAQLPEIARRVCSSSQPTFWSSRIWWCSMRAPPPHLRAAHLRNPI